MNRTPDRLWPLVVVVLCVRVTCTLAENDVAGAPPQGFRSLEENQDVEFEVTQGQKGLQATHVCVA
jgi:hypothetical protein